MASSLAHIVFFVCHQGPVDHFIAFADSLKQAHHEVSIYASGPAAQRFEQLQYPVTDTFVADSQSPEDEAKRLIDKCVRATSVITDVGHLFSWHLQKTFKEQKPDIQRLAYYDNLERDVPGEYGTTAFKVMSCANKILCANMHLATEPSFPQMVLKKGIGYYPLQRANDISSRRDADIQKARAAFLSTHAITDTGQKIFVYFGGNNKVYFEEAFPAFIRMVQSHAALFRSDYLLVFQQHPGAKLTNQDLKQLESANLPFRFIISQLPSDDLLAITYIAAYYQTSLGPVFSLCGVHPIQIAHATYPDVLVKAGIAPSITDPTHLPEALRAIESHSQKMTEEERQDLSEKMGMSSEWQTHLHSAIFEMD